MNDPCPICNFRAPEGLSPREVGEVERRHMTERHPEVVEQRMRDAGFRRGEDGEWIDTKAAAD